MSTQRVIMHIDMNSYFASCEQQDNPAWRGKPLGVCEHLGGIIIAPSIEAKRWGIKTAMPVWEAKKLFPKIILTKTSPDRYRHYTQKFLRVFGDYTDKIEKYSIDEAFLDITRACNIRITNPSFAKASADKNELGIKNGNREIETWIDAEPFKEAERIGKEIKKRITAEVGDYLKCSVGIGSNKLVAKIASDLQKPDGLTVVRSEEKHRLYDRLQLTDIPGIAKRQERNLNALGIKTLAELRDYPLSKLVAHFGIMGYHLHRAGQLEGSWKEGFAEDEPIKSMGHVYTIAQQFRRPGVFEPVLYKLCEMVGRRLRDSGLQGSRVSAFASLAKYEYIGSSHDTKYFLNDGRDIFFEARSIFRGLGLDKQLAAADVRQVGVTVSSLHDAVGQQSLFPFDAKKERLVRAMDKINDKYRTGGIAASPETFRQTSKLGDNHEGIKDGFVIARVPAFLAKNIIRDSVGFGRMRELK